jgi:hypothetical protein
MTTAVRNEGARRRNKVLGVSVIVALVLASLQLISPVSAVEGTSVVSVRAYGTSGSEVIELQINDRFVADFALSKTMDSYDYVVPATITVDTLRVYFRNDGQGRDVNVDYVALDGERHQSEAPTTWSTGSYLNGRCSPGNDSVSAWLYCNGYFKYSNAKGTVLHGPGSEEPTRPTPTTVSSTTVPPTTVPPTTVSLTTVSSTTATPLPEKPVVVVTPTPSVAGNDGTAGCRQDCTTLTGVQSLDGSQGAVLENAIITNPGGRCLTVRNARNVTIRNVTFRDCGTTGEVSDGYDTGLVLIQSSENVTIENTVFTNFASVASIDKRNNALQIEDSPNTRIINNEFRDIRSDIAQKSGDKGNRAIVVRGNNSHNLKILHNDFINPGRNALQMNRVRGVSGVEIAYNRIEGRGPWDSDFEDMINLYSSSGTATSNIAIRGNFMRNGGPSSSGTAMILGDGNTSAGPSQYITAEDNVIVDPGHVGINLAGGDHITVRNNKIFSDRDVPSDRKTTVGFTMHHFNYSEHCFANTVTGNRVYQKNQLLSSGVNHVWDTNDCGVQQSGNVWGDETLSYEIWTLD